MRLIDADELIDKLNKFESDVHGSAECYSSETEIIEAIEHVGILIDEVPTVEAVPVEAICDDLLGRYKRAHGEWIYNQYHTLEMPKVTVNGREFVDKEFFKDKAIMLMKDCKEDCVSQDEKDGIDQAITVLYNM